MVKLAPTPKRNGRFNAETDKKIVRKEKAELEIKSTISLMPKSQHSTNLLSRKITYNILVAVDEGIHLDKALCR